MTNLNVIEIADKTERGRLLEEKPVFFKLVFKHTRGSLVSLREKSDVYVAQGRTFGFRGIRAVTHITTQMAGLVSFGVGTWCSFSSSC